MARNKKDNLLQLPMEDNQKNLEIIKEELKDYVTLEIKKQYNEEVEKANKRLIKGKNRSLIWKNIIIFLLICIIGFLLYLMYYDGYFQRLFNNGNEKIVDNNTNNENKEQEKKQEEIKKPTLDDLKKEYASLLNNIYINEKSLYLKDYYQGNLHDELKNYLALNLVSFDDLNIEDDYNIISDDTLRIKYNMIFDDTYKSVNFDYNENQIRYISKISSYITDKLLEKEKTNIKRDIINIFIDGEMIIIETSEYLLKDNMKYNIITGEEITELNNGIINMAYTFSKGNLIKLENKNINYN